MDSEFVQELRRIGWKVVDQVKMKTEENFGGWYPGIIDAAILAKGSAFVGTEWSTFSFLAVSRDLPLVLSFSLFPHFSCISLMRRRRDCG